MMDRNPKLTQKSIYLPCTIESDTKTITCEALLDTGAMDNYIDIEFAKKHGLHHHPVKPLAVFNVDGTRNKVALITHKVVFTLNLGHHSLNISAYATSLGCNPLILGVTWFQKYNPSIDWVEGRLTFPKDRLIQATQMLPEHIPRYLLVFLDVFSSKTAE